MACGCAIHNMQQFIFWLTETNILSWTWDALLKLIHGLIFLSQKTFTFSPFLSMVKQTTKVNSAPCHLAIALLVKCSPLGSSLWVKQLPHPGLEELGSRGSGSLSEAFLLVVWARDPLSSCFIEAVCAWNGGRAGWGDQKPPRHTHTQEQAQKCTFSCTACGCA